MMTQEEATQQEAIASRIEEEEDSNIMHMENGEESSGNSELVSSPANSSISLYDRAGGREGGDGQWPSPAVASQIGQGQSSD